MYSKGYRYIFITLYKTWKSDLPHWNAAVLYALMTILALILVISVLGVAKYLNQLIDVRVGIVLLYGSLALINYFAFIKNGRYRKFRSEFDDMEPADRKRMYRYGIAFTILGYITPIALLILIAVL